MSNDFFEIILLSISLTHGNAQIVDPMHHARLKQIFQKLVVVHRSPSFDFNDETLLFTIGIRIERFLRHSLPAENQIQSMPAMWFAPSS